MNINEMIERSNLLYKEIQDAPNHPYEWFEVRNTERNTLERTIAQLKTNNTVPKSPMALVPDVLIRKDKMTIAFNNTASKLFQDFGDMDDTELSIVLSRITQRYVILRNLSHSENSLVP